MSAKTRIRAGDGDPRHGTVNGYTNLRCRCQPCKDAWAEFQRGAQARRHERLLAGETDVEHGLASTYGNYRCRCRPCTDAFSWDCYERSQRRRAKAS